MPSFIRPASLIMFWFHGGSQTSWTSASSTPHRRPPVVEFVNQKGGRIGDRATTSVGPSVALARLESQ